MQDIAIQNNKRSTTNGNRAEDYKSLAFAAKTRPYEDALQSLKDMLSGKQNLSIADAYFMMEAAYGETYLTAAEYKSIIRQSVDFIRQWMQQHNLNEKDNTSINYAVQQFMGDKLSIMIPKTNIKDALEIATVTHMPFSYDFQDNWGDKDHRNFFLTKCLATGTGQCNSMPAVYLVLVEALGGKAFLAVAPQHSLVKYPDSKGNIKNYEPTSHCNITNEWYYDNMFIGK